MTTYSNSRIGTFETCPLQYKYHYIDHEKTKQEDTVETFLGSYVHIALEKLYTDLKFEKLLTLKELIAFFNNEWNKNWNSTIKINKKEYTQDNYRKMGVKFISEYYNKHKPFNKGKVIGLETTDMLDIGNGQKYHIRIDRLVDMGNGYYEVHDYKTSNSLPKQEYLDNDEQLAMYSLWVKLNFKDCKKIRLVWHFLAFNKELESFRTIPELETLRKKILSKIKTIENTEEFPATKSALCNWCAYQNMCPLFKHEIKLEKKEVNEFLRDPGVKLVNQFVALKTEQKEYNEKIDKDLEKLKQALVAFCKKEGVVVVIGADHKISVKPTQSIKFPLKGTPERDKLVQLLKHIHKYNEVVDLNVSMLSNVCDNWDKKDLEKIKKFQTITNDFKLSISKK